MERRNFVLFLVLSFLVLTLNQLWVASRQPPKPAAGNAAAAGDGAAAGDEPRPIAPAIPDAPDEGPDRGAVAAAREDAAAAAPEAALPEQFVALGSVDEDSGYRMLVTLTNRGAAVRRIELASSRFSDLHDRGGYLGHLELAADGKSGLVVQVVGAGTPAAKAGLQAGDRLLEAGRGDKLATLATLADLGNVLDRLRPRQEASLVIERGGQRQTLSVALERRPLEVIRPEAENVVLRADALPAGFEAPPSFQMTLEAVDDQQRAPDAAALAGVDLDTANWRVVEPAAGQPGQAPPSDSVTFERRVPKWGLVVAKTYRLQKSAAPPADGAAVVQQPAYDLTLEVTIRNESEAAHTVSYRLDGPNGLPIEGWWYATKIGRNWSAAGLRDIVGRFFGGEPQQLGATAIAAGDVEDFEGGDMAYMGVDAQYFCVALLPQIKNPEDSWIPRASSIIAGTPPEAVYRRFANVTCRLFSEPLGLEPGRAATHAYTVFAGPKRPELLAAYRAADLPAYSLSDFVYYGWFGAVARAMVGLLHLFYGIVGNYGIAIIMLTVLVRGCMFPISRGQAKSMAKLQELRPEMDRIKEKYKGDQQKQAQAMQDLYRKHQVNPLAGCLPMLIQLPVFIGLYRGLAVDVELRQAPLLSENIRWCSNLAAPDMLLDWSGFMPRLITSGEGFFGLGPYLNLLPLITIALFLLQQKMFMPPPANEQAALQQKIMTYMMVFMGILFYKVPSGLCIYFIASSLWGIAERKLIPSPVAAATPGAASAAPAKPGRSGGALRDKPGKNGQSGGRPGVKPKRRR